MIVHGRGYLFEDEKKNSLKAEILPPLKNKIWKPFVLKNLFSFEAGKCSQSNKLQKMQNGIPYIAATNRNNGVSDFVKPIKKFISKGNALAFVCDGEGSMGFSFYKFENSIATSNIIFGYSPKINKYTASFMSTVADKVRGKYSYNYKRRLLRLQNEKLMLPVDENGEPDYIFMENFMRRIEGKLLKLYQKHIIPPPYMYNKVISHADKKVWKGFLLRDYFYFDKGNQNNMSILSEGNIPLVSAKNTNNGYKNFVVKNNKKIFRGHCLTINNDGDGGAGISYYQPVDFLLDSHVTVLIPKIEMTEKILLFIA